MTRNLQLTLAGLERAFEPDHGAFSPKQRREALERFDDLLNRDTEERHWQELFTACPYILSESLPLRLRPDDIQPRGRPGKSEPDFIIYPAERLAHPSCYGVIELKRPTTRILREPRRSILDLSADAHTAFRQAEEYLRQVDELVVCPRDQMVALGNWRHAFVICGLSEEIAARLAADVARLQERLPKDVHLIPYDVLYRMFLATVPPRLHVVVPESWHTDARLFVDDDLGPLVSLETLFDRAQLGEAERLVIQLRYGLDDGYQRPYREIAGIFEVSPARIRQIHAKAVRALRRVVGRDRLRDYLS